MEPGTLNVHITKLRKALGSDCIEAVARHGYRLTFDVREVSEEAPDHEPETQARNRRRDRFIVIYAVILLVVLVGVYAYVRHVSSVDRRPAVDMYLRALHYELAGDDEQARRILDEALSLEPKYYDACVRAAYLS